MQLSTQTNPHLMGAVSGGWMGTFIEPKTVAQGGEMDLWIAIPPLTGPEGFRTAAYAPWGYIPGGFIITNNATHPEVA